MESIGKKILTVLENKNMSQRQLSRAIGVTEVTVSRYINGFREPKGEIVARIAKVLDVSTDYLLDSVKIHTLEGGEEFIQDSAYNFDLSGLPDDAIKEVHEYIDYIKHKYRTGKPRKRIERSL